MKIVEMAEAHLQTVAKAIIDLQNQKNIIDQEIKKLNDYLQAGKEELAKSEQPLPVKQYFGE
jgi:hypothetical protein